MRWGKWQELENYSTGNVESDVPQWTHYDNYAGSIPLNYVENWSQIVIAYRPLKLNKYSVDTGLMPA